MAKAKITARKYMGDCPSSWAVFVDGKPVVTGLTKREVPYFKKLAEKSHERVTLSIDFDKMNVKVSVAQK